MNARTNWARIAETDFAEVYKLPERWFRNHVTFKPPSGIYKVRAKFFSKFYFDENIPGISVNFVIQSGPLTGLKFTQDYRIWKRSEYANKAEVSYNDVTNLASLFFVMDCLPEAEKIKTLDDLIKFYSGKSFFVEISDSGICKYFEFLDTV